MPVDLCLSPECLTKDLSNGYRIIKKLQLLCFLIELRRFLLLIQSYTLLFMEEVGLESDVRIEFCCQFEELIANCRNIKNINLKERVKCTKV